MNKKIDQKEYLKKYLGGKKSKKSKKEKKDKSIIRESKGFRLIEDFSNISNVQHGLSDEEDGFTIAEITYDDKRMKAIEEFAAVSDKWKKIVSNPDSQCVPVSSYNSGNSISFLNNQEKIYSPSRKLNHSAKEKFTKNDGSSSIPKSYDSHKSPPTENEKGSDLSSLSRGRDNSDASPLKRKRNDFDKSPPRRLRNDSGTPPPRRKRNDSDASPRRGARNDSDGSPPRRKRNDSDASPLIMRNINDSDASPPRGSRNDSDPSPPRRKRNDSDASPPRRKRNDSDASPPRRKRNDSDASPPRRKRNDSDASPPRRNRNDSDASPPRRKRNDSDASPPRRKRKDSGTSAQSRKKSNVDISPPRRYRKNSDSSPPRRRTNSESDRLPLGVIRNGSADKIENNSKEDIDRMKTARRAMTTKEFLRSRKSDKHREKGPEDIAREKRETILQKQAEVKYKSWNKGIVQGKNREESIANTVHEMGKSFSRYSNDEDMNTKLKDVLHAEDPMLAYVMKEKVESKMPIYKGSFAPNRFTLRPGYRWDGVDRSSGYESNWFASKNAKKQRDDAAYKWSVDDM